MRTVRILLFSLLCIVGGAAAEESVKPGINDHYQGARFEDWVDVFERPGREIFDRRFQIVHALGLQPGMAVADIGAGTGLLTLLMARAVRPGGGVTAVDITPDFIDNILRRAREQGLDNISGVVNAQDVSGLQAASADLVLVCATYHHFEYPQRILTSIRAGLKPGGELVIIDFIRAPGRSTRWVMGHVRGGEQDVIEEVEAAGFRLTGRRPDLLKVNYFLRFKKHLNWPIDGPAPKV